jgi:hypothetical protein
MTAMVLALWLAHAGSEITGDGTCPTPAEVREQMAAFDPRSEEDAAEGSALHQVNIFGAGSNVHVEPSIDFRLPPMPRR